MSARRFPSTIVAIVVLLGVVPRPVGAQAPAASAQGIPRAADGKPDLSGIWQVVNSAAWDIQDHHAQVFPGLPARFAMPGGQGVVEGREIPYQPWALARK